MNLPTGLYEVNAWSLMLRSGGRRDLDYHALPFNPRLTVQGHGWSLQS